MGKPVLMLAELDGDFRWFGRDGRSAWYPSARVFRQERAGEWGAAVASLARADFPVVFRGLTKNGL